MLQAFLKKMGLSNYEIRAYLALLEHENLKVKDLSQKSGVPYGRIYDVVASLRNKGLVSVLSTAPKILKALELERALNLLLEKKEEEIKLLRKEKEDILTKTEYRIKEPEEEYVYVFLGRRAAKELYGKLVRETKKELLIITSRSYRFYPDTAKLLKRKVTYKVIIPSLSKEIFPHILKAYRAGAKIKMKKLKGEISFWVRDEVECLLVLLNPKNKESRISVLIRNEDFAKVIKSFFNSLWRKAKRVSFPEATRI